MPTPPEKPGLELLIRKRGQDGDPESFKLRRLRADKAFLNLRPRRALRIHIEESELDTAGEPEFMLRNVDEDRYLRLNEEEYYLWQHIDGAHTIQDLAVAYFQAYGSFEFEVIRTFLNKGRRLGAIQVRPTTLFRAKEVAKGAGFLGALGRAATFDKHWEDVDKHFTRLHRTLGWIFATWMVPVHLLVITAGLYGYTRLRPADGFGTADTSQLLYVAVFLLALPVSIALHELSHGMATKACGRRVKSVGISVLDYIMPSVYVDVTDMFMSTRWRRIAVSLAGPGVNLVVAAGFVGLAALDRGNGAWVAVADANYFLVAVTLWPFLGLKEDGYDAITDLVRVTALREHAWQLVTWFLPWVEDDAPPRPWWPPAIYLAAVLGSWGVLASMLLSLR